MTRCLVIFLWLVYIKIGTQPLKTEHITFFGNKIQPYSKYLFGRPYKYNSHIPPHPNWGGLRRTWTNANAWDIVIEENTPVYSIISGYVFSTRFKENGKTVWGYNIIIENDNEKIFYTHLDEVIVCPGDTIKEGQLVGFIGKWPASYKFPDGTHMPSHLHIALYNGGLNRYLTEELKIERPLGIRWLVGI